MLRAPFPSRGGGMTEVLGLPAGGGCMGGGFSFTGGDPGKTPRHPQHRVEGGIPGSARTRCLWAWRDGNSMAPSLCCLPQVASFGQGLCLRFKLPVFN